jgi:raffinose/stachyose/melibiose transport system permease protein
MDQNIMPTVSLALESAKQGRISLARFIAKYGFAYLLILPALSLYLLFVVYPFFATFYLSLTSWNGADPVIQFVGLDNYRAILNDSTVWLAFRHNLIWTIVGPVGAIGFGMFLAVLLRRRPFGFTFFRTVYFMPQVLGPAMVGFIWTMIYTPRRGFLYHLGDLLQWPFIQQGFLGKIDTVLFAVIIAAVWASIGFYFVILLAGMQSVDQDLIDASRVDGANSWQEFRFVILPQLSNVLTVVMVLAIIGSLKVFDIVWTMTRGGPANASEVIGTYSYNKAFLESNFGYASAVIMLMSLFTLVMAIVFIRVRERNQE